MTIQSSRFIKWAAAAAVTLGAFGAASVANAGVSWSIGIGVPGVVAAPQPYYYEPAPVYYDPPPRYYRPPPPVYYRPPPVYVRPAPIYYQAPRGYYGGRRDEWRGHGHRGWRDRDGDGRRDWR